MEDELGTTPRNLQSLQKAPKCQRSLRHSAKTIESGRHKQPHVGRSTSHGPTTPHPKSVEVHHTGPERPTDGQREPPEKRRKNSDKEHRPVPWNNNIVSTLALFVVTPSETAPLLSLTPPINPHVPGKSHWQATTIPPKGSAVRRKPKNLGPPVLRFTILILLSWPRAPVLRFTLWILLSWPPVLRVTLLIRFSWAPHAAFHALDPAVLAPYPVAAFHALAAAFLAPLCCVSRS